MEKAPEWKLLQPPHRLDGNLILETKHAAAIVIIRSVLPCLAAANVRINKKKITILKAPIRRAFGHMNIIELLVISQLNFGTLTKIIEFIWQKNGGSYSNEIWFARDVTHADKMNFADEDLVTRAVVCWRKDERDTKVDR